jgi:hypothetical protein
MGGFADDKNTESVIIVFFPPFFCLQIFGRKMSDKIIRSESADRCGLDIITFKIGKKQNL